MARTAQKVSFIRRAPRCPSLTATIPSSARGSSVMNRRASAFAKTRLQLPATAAASCRIFSTEHREQRNAMQPAMLDSALSAVTLHMIYFAIALVAIAVFVAIYTAITPYWEIRLIRQGNTAAAISLGGAV